MRRNRRYGRAPVLPGSLPLEVVVHALSCETRLEVLRCLAQSEMAVTQIADRLELAVNTISHNLRVLWDAGIVEVECSGAKRIYRFVSHVRREVTKDGLVIRVPCRNRTWVAIGSQWDPYTKPNEADVSAASAPEQVNGKARGKKHRQKAGPPS